MLEDPEIRIVVPGRSDGEELADGLRHLTETICTALKREEGYGLGGEFGYGTEFENEVFAMHQFWWGDCECGWAELSCDESHDSGCYQVALSTAEKAAGVHWEQKNDFSYDEKGRRREVIYARLITEFDLPKRGCAIHCTCTYDPVRFPAWFQAFKKGPAGHAEDCPVERPHFHHKPTGLKVRWYKWIGRDMEIQGSVDVARILAECEESLLNRSEGLC